ncbi:glycosyl hydrolase, partial [Bacteroidota bacterium]
MKYFRYLLKSLTSLFFLTLYNCQGVKEKPNVIYILTDQWRASAFGYTGDPNVRTPNIDSFAREAVNLDNAVSVAPVSTPYRGSLLTGRYPTSTGMFLNDLYLPEEELCMAEIFKSESYNTAYLGKWHLDGHGRFNDVSPERRQGFDYWKALECSHEYNKMPYYDNSSPEMKYWEGYSPFAISKEAQKYLSEQSESKRPFLLFVSIGTPHFPHASAPQEYKDLYPESEIQIAPNVPEKLHEKVRKELSGYYAHCTATDKAIGDLIKKIKELGLMKNTIIVFTSDHGEMMGAHGVRPRSKQVAWDESVHVPFLISYPGIGKQKGTVEHTPITTPDILPSLLGFANIPVPNTIEGEDLSGFIKSPDKETDRSALFMNVCPFTAENYNIEYRGIRTNEFSYVRTLQGPSMLFNHITDPYQLNNLLGKEEYKELEILLEKKLQKTLRKIGDENFKARESYLDKWNLELNSQNGTHIDYMRFNNGLGRVASPKKKVSSVETYSYLKENFKNPDANSGPRCWWWWLNSNVTKEAITRDLEAMHDKGFSGAMIFDAGTELNWGKDLMPPNGPMFSGPEWQELYLHALEEAERLGLEIGLSIQSGWNLGGPGVSLDDKAKQITWSEIRIEGSAGIDQKLPVPKSNYNYYRDICLFAYPTKQIEREPISNLTAKTGARELGGSAPDCRFLLNDNLSVEGEQDALLSDIIDITDKLDKNGILKWDVPAGKWTVLRIGYTPTLAHVKTSSDNWKGHVIDYLSKDVFNRYWDEVVDPLMKKAGPLAGTVLKQLETDSWECGGMNWSTGFAEDFRLYTGYDIIKYLPVIAGKIIENREVSNAFLADLRKTIAYCVSENHYKTFAERAAEYKLGIQPESSGPHAAPVDGITNYSHSNIVMSEFWVPSPHRPNPENRFFVKQASSAAHIYGKQYVGAESFTSLKNPHWANVLWQSHKPAMDYEFCEGLNMIFFHTFTCSPKEMGIPGQEYFAGTHVNPQVSWWKHSDAFMDYINRIQSIVQQGKFVADVLYYYGDHVPNIAVNKGFNRAGALPGYDFDVTNEEVLLKLKVENGKLVVPGGIRYRVLVLPDHKVLSLAVLEKVRQLLKKGATVLGPKPERLVSLVGGKSAQKKFHNLANKLWGNTPSDTGMKNIGKGRLVWGQSSRDFLQNQGVAFDFELIDTEKQLDYQYIHYTIDDADVYFVCNQTGQTKVISCAFRVSGKQPELWNPVTGQITTAEAFEQTNGRTIIPMEFNPYGSCFVIFRETITSTKQGTESSNYPVLDMVKEIQGPWQLAFDPDWGGPASVEFKTLSDWTQHSNQGIKYYSGETNYTNTFEFEPIEVKHYWLQLNQVDDVGIASVKLNGKDIGITWTSPFLMEITGALKSGQNQLEITVVNSWQNRLIGDRGKAQEYRFTKTNINIKDDWKLRRSGLLGPVE